VGNVNMCSCVEVLKFLIYNVFCILYEEMKASVQHDSTMTSTRLWNNEGVLLSNVGHQFEHKLSHKMSSR
jgi:hypothetical protein